MSNEAKFTKGPWAALDHGAGEVVVYEVESEEALCVFSSDYGGWAWKTSYEVSNEALANANLIAAAPELYDYLYGIYFNSCMAGEDGDEVEEIQQLLAKARGKS
jgi:hypothetical protein